MMTDIPIKTKYSKSNACTYVELWHLCKGKWHHIVQVIKKGQIVYYTDGEKELPPLVPFKGED